MELKDRAITMLRIEIDINFEGDAPAVLSIFGTEVDFKKLMLDITDIISQKPNPSSSRIKFILEK